MLVSIQASDDAGERIREFTSKKLKEFDFKDPVSGIKKVVQEFNTPEQQANAELDIDDNNNKALAALYKVLLLQKAYFSEGDLPPVVAAGKKFIEEAKNNSQDDSSGLSALLQKTKEEVETGFRRRIARSESHSRWAHKIPKDAVTSRRWPAALRGSNEGAALLLPIAGVQATDSVFGYMHGMREADVFRPGKHDKTDVKGKKAWETTQYVADATVPVVALALKFFGGTQLVKANDEDVPKVFSDKGLVGKKVSRHYLCPYGIGLMTGQLAVQLINLLHAYTHRKSVELTQVQKNLLQRVWRAKPLMRRQFLQKHKNASKRLKLLAAVRALQALASGAVIPASRATLSMGEAENATMQKIRLARLEKNDTGELHARLRSTKKDFRKKGLGNFGITLLASLTDIIHKVLLISHRSKMAKDVRQLLAQAEAVEKEWAIVQKQQPLPVSMVRGQRKDVDA